MNSKTLKNNKKVKLSTKSLVFWSVIACAVLALIITLVITSIRSRSVNSYDKLLKDDAVIGSEIYLQEEKEYMVLIYDFNGSKDMETFDNEIYTYLNYYNNNKGKDGVKKLYAADVDEIGNQSCFKSGLTSNVIKDTTRFYDSFDPTATTVLQLKKDTLPILIVISEGKATADYCEGEQKILTYLAGLKK